MLRILLRSVPPLRSHVRQLLQSATLHMQLPTPETLKTLNPQPQPFSPKLPSTMVMVIR